jgi:hypothetical protein
VSHRIPNPTRDDVLGAIAMCDHLGVGRFLTAYGYAPSRRYVVRYAGRSYPSKAILGVAAGMNAYEFSGGAAHTGRVLGRLGFSVRRGTPRGLDPELAELAELAAEGFEYEPPSVPELPVDPVAYFASGSNHPGEIRAFADIGHDVGVSARELSKAGELELLALAGTDVQVFVDSGAFSEVRFGPDGPVVVAEMDDVEWRRVLCLYQRLAMGLGDQLHVVAPDRVGDQAVTLERLARYQLDLYTLRRMGARILLPVQRGALTQASFYRHACGVLGFEPVPALPCKKAATSVFEAFDFVREVKPATVHLLGLGARNRRAGDYLEACRNGRADVLVQMDSVVITAMVGRTNGRGGRPRRLTAASDLAFALSRSCARLGTTAARKYFALVLALGLF